jgi:hypothetical protein
MPTSLAVEVDPSLRFAVSKVSFGLVDLFRGSVKVSSTGSLGRFLRSLPTVLDSVIVHEESLDLVSYAVSAGARKGIVLARVKADDNTILQKL